MNEGVPNQLRHLYTFFYYFFWRWRGTYHIRRTWYDGFWFCWYRASNIAALSLMTWAQTISEHILLFETKKEKDNRSDSDGKSECIKHRFLSSSTLARSLELHKTSFMHSWACSFVGGNQKQFMDARARFSAICVSLSRYTCCKCQYKYSEEKKNTRGFMLVERKWRARVMSFTVFVEKSLNEIAN